VNMQIRTKAEIWLNGKYFFTADLVEIKYNQKNKAPNSANDSSATGTVVSLTKNELTAEEKEQQKKVTDERDFDAFYKEMSKKTRNPEFHIPVEWKD